METLDYSLIAAGNVKWYNYFGKLTIFCKDMAFKLESLHLHNILIQMSSFTFDKAYIVQGEKQRK